MDIKRETEYENPPVIIKCVADIPGGYTLDAGEMVSDTLKQGALVSGRESDGLCHVIKTALLHADATDAATTYQVKKGSEFKTGDIISTSALTIQGQTITNVNTDNAAYDVITVDTTLGTALTAANNVIFVQVAAEGASPALKYTPKGVCSRECDLTYGNQGIGVMTIGTVNGLTAPYWMNATLRAKVPLIQYLYI